MKQYVWSGQNFKETNDLELSEGPKGLVLVQFKTKAIEWLNREGLRRLGTTGINSTGLTKRKNSISSVNVQLL